MKRETNTPKPHIVLCAPKKTGKTTLIERIMQETKAPTDEPPIPVYGFQTKRIACSDGVNRIYMFPAGHVQTNSLPSDTCYLGSTCGRVRDVCTAAIWKRMRDCFFRQSSTPWTEIFPFWLL